MLAELLRLFEYNHWAHERTLAAAARLPAADYERAIPSSFPSVRATLEHLLAAESVWLSRWQGDPLGRAPDLAGVADAAALGARWAELRAAQRAFLGALAEADLARPVAIRTRTGITTEQPLGDTLLHVVNHGTYHRGQVTTLLRQLGAEPVATDLFLFNVERAGA